MPTQGVTSWRSSCRNLAGRAENPAHQVGCKLHQLQKRKVAPDMYCTDVLYLPLLTAYNLQQMIGFFKLLLRSLKSEEWPTGQSNAPSIVAKLYVTMSSSHIFSKLSQKIQTFKICKNMRYIGTHMFIICI